VARIIPAFTLSYYFNAIIVVYLVMLGETLIKSIVLWMIFKQEKWQKIKI
jgi:Na+-driven multidrug efflux pump